MAGPQGRLFIEKIVPNVQINSDVCSNVSLYQVDVRYVCRLHTGRCPSVDVILEGGAIWESRRQCDVDSVAIRVDSCQRQCVDFPCCHVEHDIDRDIRARVG